MEVQTEKAYQKQDGLNTYNKYLLYGEELPKVVRKKKGASKKVGKKMKAIRYFKNVGLGFKVPADAIQSEYVDKKCPFTGNVSIRGRILKGLVLSTKMKNAVIVRRDYLHYVKKYQRYQKHHRNIAAHCSPALKKLLREILPLLDNADHSQKLLDSMFFMFKVIVFSVLSKSNLCYFK